MIISANARVGFLIPKNNALQSMFKIKLVPKKTVIFGFVFSSAFIQAKYKDKAIKMNNMLQAMGKTKLGGVMLGLIS